MPGMPGYARVCHIEMTHTAGCHCRHCFMQLQGVILEILRFLVEVVGQQESAYRKRNDATTLCTSNRSFGHRPLSGWSGANKDQPKTDDGSTPLQWGSSRWPSWHRPPSGWSWANQDQQRSPGAFTPFHLAALKGAPWCCSVAGWIRLRYWTERPRVEQLP